MKLRKIKVNTGILIKWKHGNEIYASYVDNNNHDKDYTYCLTTKQTVCPPIKKEAKAC